MADKRDLILENLKTGLDALVGIKARRINELRPLSEGDFSLFPLVEILFLDEAQDFLTNNETVNNMTVQLILNTKGETPTAISGFIQLIDGEVFTKAKLKRGGNAVLTVRSDKIQEPRDEDKLNYNRYFIPVEIIYDESFA